MRLTLAPWVPLTTSSIRMNTRLQRADSLRTFFHCKRPSVESFFFKPESNPVFRLLIYFNEFHRLVAEELAKFHEAARGSDLYVDKSCGPGDVGWMDPINRNTMSSLKELEAKGEHSDV